LLFRALLSLLCGSFLAEECGGRLYLYLENTLFKLGAAGRNSYLDVLLKLADKYKKKMWGWLWTEAGAQSELENALGIGGFGYPAMAAINARKMKFALLKGSFSEQGINEFLRELSFGRGSTAPVGGGAFPAISAREPWDGKDGEVSPRGGGPCACGTCHWGACPASSYSPCPWASLLFVSLVLSTRRKP